MGDRSIFEEFADELETILNKFRAANEPNQPTRQRYLSLAITELEAAQDWLYRAAREFHNDQ